MNSLVIWTDLSYYTNKSQAAGRKSVLRSGGGGWSQSGAEIFRASMHTYRDTLHHTRARVHARTHRRQKWGGGGGRPNPKSGGGG